MNANNHKYIFIQCQSNRTLTFLFHRRLVSAVQANIRHCPRVKVQKLILCVFVLAVGTKQPKIAACKLKILMFCVNDIE